jgi:tetratricopeptide (TPR) repeat protein
MLITLADVGGCSCEVDERRRLHAGPNVHASASRTCVLAIGLIARCMRSLFRPRRATGTASEDSSPAAGGVLRHRSLHHVIARSVQTRALPRRELRVSSARRGHAMNVFASARALVVLLLATIVACKGNAVAMHRDKGYEYADKGDWKNSAAEYGESLRLDPNQETIWEQKAYAHLQLREYDDAAAALYKFADFKKEPAKKAAVLRNLGGMYMQAPDYEKAEKAFAKAFEVDPTDDQALTWLGEIYSVRGGARGASTMDPNALHKAVEYYDKVIAIKPDIPASYINERIVFTKLLEYEQKQKDAAAKDAAAAKTDPARVQELQASVADHQGRIDQLKKQIDDVTHKFAEAQKLAQTQTDK